MLHHTKQASMQCWITSVAILTGRTVQEMLNEFNKYTKYDYDQLARGSDNKEFYHAAHCLLAELGLKRITLTHLYTYSAIPGQTKTVRNRLTASLLKGRGILNTGKQQLDGVMWHAVAFEDGMVADPNLDMVYPFKIWKFLRGRITNFRIEYLS